MISKIGNSNFVKWTFIILVCYLLASIGVNGVFNPYYYINPGEKVELETLDKDGYIVINTDSVNEENGYLNIVVDDMNAFQTVVNTVYNYESENTTGDVLYLGKGINSGEFSDMQKISNIAILQKELSDAELVIDSVYWSRQKQVNTWKMLEITISFIALVAFYRFMTWIKNKYAK